MPQRIRLSRKKGYRMPPNTVSVAWPSPWANPHRPKVRSPEANAEAVRRFEMETVPARLAEDPAYLSLLRGQNLACWCEPGLPCHADVLLRLANG